METKQRVKSQKAEKPHFLRRMKTYPRVPSWIWDICLICSANLQQKSTPFYLLFCHGSISSKCLTWQQRSECRSTRGRVRDKCCMLHKKVFWVESHLHFVIFATTECRSGGGRYLMKTVKPHCLSPSPPRLQHVCEITTSLSKVQVDPLQQSQVKIFNVSFLLWPPTTSAFSCRAVPSSFLLSCSTAERLR